MKKLSYWLLATVTLGMMLFETASGAITSTTASWSSGLLTVEVNISRPDQVSVFSGGSDDDSGTLLCGPDQANSSYTCTVEMACADVPALVTASTRRDQSTVNVTGAEDCPTPRQQATPPRQPTPEQTRLSLSVGHPSPSR